MPLTQARPPTRPGAEATTLPASTYHRLNALCPTLNAGIMAAGSLLAPGWIEGVAIPANTQALNAFLDAEAARIEARHGHTARPDVVATKALHGYLWAVCLLMSGPWYLQRRVPQVRPADIRVELATGRLGIVPGEFVCLPDDPASNLPGVRTLPHEEALRAELRRTVADHAQALLTALGPRLRRGPRALWGMVGDDLVSGIWHLGRALGQEEQAARQATELLPGPLAPFPGGADFRKLTDAAGGSQLTRTRLGCCLHYTIRPAEACATCPRVCDAERLRMAAASSDNEPVLQH